MSGWLPQTIKRRGPQRRLLVDALFACLIAVLAVVDVASTDEGLGVRRADLAAYALVLIGTFSLVWRRSRPNIVLGFIALVLVVFWARGYGTLLPVLGLPSLYAVAAHSQNRRQAWATIVVVGAVLTAVASLTILRTLDGFAYFRAGSMVAYLAGATAVGVAIRNRDRIFADTQRRADEAEADRLAAAQRAVASERNRIAREMHDVVAHGMSVIAVQAAAAQEIARTDPEKTIEVLAKIETVGRESLSEMRRMLGVLRTEGGPAPALAPQPTLGDISELVSQSVQSGVAAELTVAGEGRELPAGVQLAAFRIVQEALTNVRKHATNQGAKPASAAVNIGYSTTAITVEITDDGVGAGMGAGNGKGLIGMRERVEIYGGELSTGPLAGGGFAVRAVLPVASSETRPTVAAASTTPPTEAAS